MTHSRAPGFTLLATLVLLATLIPVPAGAAAAQPQIAAGGSQPIQIPVAFEANQGQVDAPAQFVARVPGGATYFFSAQEMAAVLSRQGSGSPEQLALKVRFLGASPEVRLEGESLLPGRSNYLLGNDPGHWQQGVPSYASLVYHDLYPQTDLRYHSAEGRLKYDLVLRPGAEVERVALAYAGADGLRVNAAGQLEIQTAWGKLVEETPRAWQEEPAGERAPVDVRYVLGPGSRVGFRLGAYDPARTLIIDPTLRYSTFVGGSNADSAQDVVLDSAGNALVTGATSSVNFPTTTGVYSPTHSGGQDVYVLKLAADGGSLLFSTYLGGAGDETGYGLDLNSSGNIVVTGSTASANFPTTATADSINYNGGASDAFVTTLSADGASLLFSTYLGGDKEDIAYAVEVAQDFPEDQPVVTGVTSSKDFPTSGDAYQRNHGGAQDVFVTRLQADATSLRYSTLVGGTDVDAGQALTVDEAGSVLVTGYTYSTDFPTTSGVPDRNLNGGQDAFVLRLSSKGTSLRFSTYLGGTGNDSGQGVALDRHENPFVTGKTASADFATSAGAYDVGHNGGEDAFVTKLDKDGTVLEFSTFVGGASADAGRAVIVDFVGNPVVAGYSRSSNFPTSADAYDPAYNGEADAVLFKLAADGKSLIYATFAGGSMLDEAQGLALSSGGDAIVAGRTQSSNFPTTVGAYDPVYNGAQDAFVLRLDGLGSLPKGTIDVAVTQSSDDAEENDDTGTVYLDNLDLKLVRRGGAQTVGLRFQGITIPRASTILDATIDFTAYETERKAAALTFHGQDIDAAPTFSVTVTDISTRTTTTASVDWRPVPAWEEVGETYQTPDLSAVVQEIVDRNGWSSGNPLAFIITGSGSRAAVSYDGAASEGNETLAPRLRVAYGDRCYHLDASASPPAAGSVAAVPEPNCRGGLYTAGTQVQLTAVPAEGYTLASWSGDASGNASPTTISMDGDKTVTASFKTATCYTLTTMVEPAASGSVSASPAPNCGAAKYAENTQVTLTATPAPDHVFASWSGAVTGLENPVIVTVDAAKSVTANFRQETCYGLITTANPPGSGTVTVLPAPNCGGGKYVTGTDVQLTAAPALDHVLLGWAGDASGTVNPVGITMDGDKSVTATFIQATCHSLVANVNPPGAGQVLLDPPANCGGGEYADGITVTLTASPSAGYAFDHWSGDVTGTASPETLPMDGDKLLTAHFGTSSQIYLPLAFRNRP